MNEVETILEEANRSAAQQNARVIMEALHLAEKQSDDERFLNSFQGKWTWRSVTGIMRDSGLSEDRVDKLIAWYMGLFPPLLERRSDPVMYRLIRPVPMPKVNLEAIRDLKDQFGIDATTFLMDGDAHV